MTKTNGINTASCLDRQPTPTGKDLAAGLAIIQAVAETVREAGECPSGTIYAALVGRVSLGGYQRILSILTGAGLIEVSGSHMIRWSGPSFPAGVKA